MKQTIILIFLILMTSNFGMTQVQKSDQFNSWYTYSGNHKLNSKISIHTLYSWRRSDFIKNWQQSLLRIGFNYKLHRNLTITPGYDWAVTFPYGEQPILKKVNEHRIYEQFLLKNTIGRLNLSHRYRIEQRFIENNTTYLFKIRFRYRLTAVLPLNNKEMTKNTVFLKVFDELFINYRKGIGSHYFDQNWAYIGIGFQFTENAKVSVGYMNQFLPKSDLLRIENNHTLSIGINYGIDFRK